MEAEIKRLRAELAKLRRILEACAWVLLANGLVALFQATNWLVAHWGS